MLDSLRDAFRSLRRSPGFALLTVGILAIGVGLNAAIFTVVDCVLLRPLGYHDANRIVSIRTRFLDENRTIPRLGGGDYVDLAAQVHGIESAAYYTNWDGAVQIHGETAIAPLAYVSPRFGQVLGVQPLAGRLFTQYEAKGLEALVSASFARNYFGSPAQAIGQPMHGEQDLYTIVGVLPDGFSFPSKTNLWFEQTEKPENLNRTSYNAHAVAKRRSGVSEAQLAAELLTLSKHLQHDHPEDKSKALEATSLQESIVGTIAPTLHLLVGSVAVILLIVCANITHLQLIRATRQVREVAVRSALGASRRRIAMRAMLEAATLSVAGCAGALLLALPALRLFLHLAPEGLPRLNEVQLNWHVLLYSLLISFLLMTATALLPVWHSWRVDQSLVLRQDSARGLESRGAVRVRTAFLVAQVAFTLVLATAAVLLARQLVAQAREDLGFSMDNVFTLDANVVEPVQAQPTVAPETSAAEAVAKQAQLLKNTQRLARLNNALDTLRATPGVTAAEAINGAPLGFGGSNVLYAIRGRSVFAAGAKLPGAELKPITPSFLSALRVPLLRGRSFTQADRFGAEPVVLVSQALAEQVFHGEDPVGHQIMCGYDSAGEWWTIVGVVGSVKDTPGSLPQLTLYVPIAQHAARAGAMQLLVRTAPGSRLTAETLRQRLQQAHPNFAATATSMHQNFTEVERDLRFRSLLFESFAGVSLLLAMLGMYGATAYSVAQRTFEFGLRMALGASRQQVMASVLRRSLWTAVTGAAVGIGLYVLLVRVFSSLVGKLPADPAAVVAAACGIVLLSLLAAAVPAHCGSTIDPMRALRME